MAELTTPPFTDYLFEVLAAELQEASLPSAWLVQPQGTFARGYHSDVVAITREHPDEPWRFGLSRDGLYDALPELFFHSAEKRENAVETVKANDEIAAASRLFFQPIENEQYRIRVSLEQLERSATWGSAQLFQSEIFMRLWPDLADVAYNYLPLLMRMLPQAHAFCGNLDYLNHYLPQLLQIPASLQESHDTAVMAGYANASRLGQAALGVDSLLGLEPQAWGSTYTLTLGPLTQTQMAQFAPGAPGQVVIHKIKRYFLPVDGLFHQIIQLRDEDKPSPTSPYAQDEALLLGFDSYV